MSSSRLRRAKSADRVTSDRSRRDYDLSAATTASSKCDLVGFPYCCTAHYNSYRRWPYYLDPLDYPYSYSRYRGRYWPDWPYYDHYHRRPWYLHEDDYYRDYLRGYTEGLRKYDSQRKLSGEATAAETTTALPSYLDRYPYWWYYNRPYYYRRYL